MRNLPNIPNNNIYQFGKQIPAFLRRLIDFCIKQPTFFIYNRLFSKTLDMNLRILRVKLDLKKGRLWIWKVLCGDFLGFK